MSNAVVPRVRDRPIRSIAGRLPIPTVVNSLPLDEPEFAQLPRTQGTSDFTRLGRGKSSGAVLDAYLTAARRSP